MTLVFPSWAKCVSAPSVQVHLHRAHWLWRDTRDCWQAPDLVSNIASWPENINWNEGLDLQNPRTVQHFSPVWLFQVILAHCRCPMCIFLSFLGSTGHLKQRHIFPRTAAICDICQTMTRHGHLWTVQKWFRAKRLATSWSSNGAQAVAQSSHKSSNKCLRCFLTGHQWTLALLSLLPRFYQHTPLLTLKLLYLACFF